MNTKQLLTIAGLVLAFGTGSAWAQDQRGTLDETIRLAGQAHAEMPAAIIGPISLPDAAKDNPEAVAASESEYGLDIATKARLLREAALTEIREAAMELTDAAQDNAESASRVDDFIPAVPEIPDVPGGGG